MLKRILFVLLAIGVVSSASYALTTDCFTITVTVTLNYSVQIATTTGGVAEALNINMSQMSQLFLSTGVDYTTLSLTTATVYNNGNTRADWQIKGDIASAGPKPWAFGYAEKDTVAVDSITCAVVLGDPAKAANNITGVTDASFAAGNTNDLINTTWKNLNWPNNTLEAADDYTGDGDDVFYSATNSRILFYRLRMPSDISTSDEQRITVSIRALPTGTF